MFLVLFFMTYSYFDPRFASFINSHRTISVSFGIIENTPRVFWNTPRVLKISPVLLRNNMALFGNNPALLHNNLPLFGNK